MYPVTELFKTRIKETTRIFKLSVEIQHSTGVLELDDKDIVGGSVSFTENSQVGDDFNVGGVVASTFDIEIFRKLEHDLIKFEGATVVPQVGLLLSSSVDAENYFINAPQPSEFESDEAQELWEYVPLGRFNVDEVIKARNSIKLKALDCMIELDKPYSLSSLSYPATIYQIYQNICTVADVLPATTAFVNQNYIVQTRPEGDYTLRDMLSYVAELSGSFARMNRTGALELFWYTSSGLTLTGANRFDFKPREDLIQIKGVKFETEDAVYIAGTDEYVVDLSDNPLLQSDYATVISNIYNKVNITIFTPFESRWQGNPAIQAGDIITQIDRDGVSHATLVTHSTYKYRGASSLAARGLPVKAKGYKGSTNKKISNIVRREIKPIGDKIPALEQAILNTTQLIANMLGGYSFQEADAFYIADNPVLADAQKVWKWGIGGFGYSSTGITGPYTTAISADGTIVAMLIAANIITADMVQTGILSSTDDSTWINLNDGTFNFKNLLKYVDGVLTMPSNVVRSDIPYNGTTIGTSEGIHVEFAEGGRAVIGSGGVSVQHNDGSYTKINGRGIMRQFSIPIFEQLPSDVDIIETFESGDLAQTRIDRTNAWRAFYSEWGSSGSLLNDSNIQEYIKITTDKYSGSYALKIENGGALHGSTGLMCYFINYRPTKNTTLTLKYKTVLSTNSYVRMDVQDMDSPNGETTSVNLNSSSWATASAFLEANVTYRLGFYLLNYSDSSSIKNSITIDDVVFEEDVNEPVIVGYEQSLQPYYDFTYTRKGTFAAGEAQKQITLPDYFRGLIFEVYITPPSSWDFYSNTDNDPPSIKLLSVNNTIPSFTVSCARYPSTTAVDFLYTVVLVNN